MRSNTGRNGNIRRAREPIQPQVIAVSRHSTAGTIAPLDLCSFACRFAARTNTLCAGRRHRQHALDNIGYYYCQIIYRLYGHAGQRPT